MKFWWFEFFSTALWMNVIWLQDRKYFWKVHNLVKFNKHFSAMKKKGDTDTNQTFALQWIEKCILNLKPVPKAINILSRLSGFLHIQVAFLCPPIYHSYVQVYTQLVINVKNLHLDYWTGEAKWNAFEKSLCILQFVALTGYVAPYKGALIYAFKLKKLNSTAQWNNCNSRLSPGEVIIFNMMYKLHNWIQNMVQFFSSNKNAFSSSPLHFIFVLMSHFGKRERKKCECACNCIFIMFFHPRNDEIYIKISLSLAVKWMNNFHFFNKWKSFAGFLRTYFSTWIMRHYFICCGNHFSTARTKRS